MKIDYTREDASRISRAYFSLPNNDTRAAQAVRDAFRKALDLCGVKYVAVERRKSHAFNIFAPNGGPFLSAT